MQTSRRNKYAERNRDIAAIIARARPGAIVNGRLTKTEACELLSLAPGTTRPGRHEITGYVNIGYLLTISYMPDTHPARNRIFQEKTVAMGL